MLLAEHDGELFLIRPVRRLFALGLAPTLTLAIASLIAPGCSFVLKSESTQCASDDECVGRGGEFLAFPVCDRAKGQCVAGTTTARVDRCETNAQCASGRATSPRTCVANRCEDVLTPECGELLGDPAGPNAILFGLTVAEKAGWSRAVAANYRLAMEDLVTAGGVPDGEGGRRAVGAVVCDIGTADAPTKVSQHLFGRLGIQVVVANGPRDHIDRLISEMPPAGTGVVLSASPLLESLTAATATSEKILYTAGSFGAVLGVYGPLLAQLETKLRAERGLTELRVALISSETPNAAALAQRILDIVRVNGAPLRAQEGTTLRRFNSRDLADAPRTLTQFNPAVILVSTPAGATPFVIPVDKDWPSSAPRPIYVLGPDNLGDAELRAYLASSLVEPPADKLRRFLGVTWEYPASKQLYEDYRKRFTAKFTRYPGGDSFDNFFSAVYVAVYGAYATVPVLRRGLLRGTDVRAKLLSMSEGSILARVGPEFLGASSPNNAFTALAQPGAQIEDTLGRVRFNALGERVVRGSVYCFAQQGGGVVEALDAMRLDAAGTSITGSCPEPVPASL